MFKFTKNHIQAFIHPPSRIPRSLGAGMKRGFKSFAHGFIPSGKAGGFIGVAAIGVLFLVSSHLSQKYQNELKQMFAATPLWGAMVYLCITIFAVVAAPIVATPFIPVASHIWGGFWAGILNITGWTAGAVIAFFIGRRWGTTLVKKFITAEKLEKTRKLIPQKNFFWSAVFLRIVLPVDILSYTLGIFTDIKFPLFFFATLLGVLPFGFLLSYAVKLPFMYQVVVLALGIFLALAALLKYKQKVTRKERKNRA